jgi:hypothetical protein
LLISEDQKEGGIEWKYYKDLIHYYGGAWVVAVLVVGIIINKYL